MPGLEVDVQKAVYTALVGDATLAGLLADHYQLGSGNPAVYDDPPQPADTGDDSYFPYVLIGDDTVADWSTDTALGAIVMVNVQAWSRADGRKELKDIQGAVYDVLTRAELTLDNHEFIGIEFDSSETIVESDNETRQSIQTFRLILDEVGYGE